MRFPQAFSMGAMGIISFWCMVLFLLQCVIAQTAEPADSGNPLEGTEPRQIKFISLIAERHSGSKWMQAFLELYFRAQGISVVSTLCTWKHWFQSRIHEGIQSGERSCRPTQPCPVCHDTNHTLVVALWRNPYDWTTAMSELPYHSKWHFGLGNELSKFLTKRWMVPAEREIAFRKAASEMDPSTDFCISNFLPSEVVPCIPEHRESIYELDENGEAYGNIYELRKAKIQDFNAVREWVPMYEQIRYEDMLHVDLLMSWVHSLESRYGLVGNRARVPSEKSSAAMEAKLRLMFYTNSTHCAPMCPMGKQHDAVETLNELFDEELEASIGYHKIFQ